MFQQSHALDAKQPEFWGPEETSEVPIRLGKVLGGKATNFQHHDTVTLLGQPEALTAPPNPEPIITKSASKSRAVSWVEPFIETSEGAMGKDSAEQVSRKTSFCDQGLLRHEMPSAVNSRRRLRTPMLLQSPQLYPAEANHVASIDV